MRILQRYFLREMTLNFLGVTGALASILFIYQLGAVLKRAADYQYPRELVLRLFALGAAENFSLLLPLGLLLGVVLALGRFYHESEMTAAQACGYGRVQAWLPVIILALPVAALSAWLNLQFAPEGGAPTRDADRRSAARRAWRCRSHRAVFAASMAAARWSTHTRPTRPACCSGCLSSREVVRR